MSRLRLGVTLTHQFSVRYLLQTGLLERLSRELDPVVLVSWDDPRLAAELARRDIELRRLPNATFSLARRRNRRMIDNWHRRLLRSPSTAIDARRNDAERIPLTRFRLGARRAFERNLTRLPVVVDRMLAKEHRLLHEEPGWEPARREIHDARLDAVLSVTPFHGAEELVLRAAAEVGVPLITSILSFDNITTRGWIPVLFDHYLVWNARNAAELRRAYPQTVDRVVEVVGAPQFDFYADESYRWDERRWRTELGLPHGRPVLLFGGGPWVIAPQEPHVLGQLDRAVSAGELPDDPVILFRRHPMDPLGRWEPTLSASRNVVVDEPWADRGDLATSWAGRADLEKLVSTLAHSAVHLSTSSTMSVDGAALDRPQIGLGYDDRPGRPADRVVRELYEREHWLAIGSSGGMTVATDRADLISAVGSGLTDPGRQAAGRRRLVEEIITFRDGRSTERVATAILGFLGHLTDAPNARPPDGGPAG